MTTALPYIPQRPPFVMVDNLLSCDETTIRTDFQISADNLFVCDGKFTEAGLMENIAQTCATRIGWLNKDKPVRIGVIGSISNFEVLRLPKVGERLETTVAVDSAVFDAIIVHAESSIQGEPIAHCDMKVFVIGSE